MTLESSSESTSSNGVDSRQTHPLRREERRQTHPLHREERRQTHPLLREERRQTHPLNREERPFDGPKHCVSTAIGTESLSSERESESRTAQKEDIETSVDVRVPQNQRKQMQSLLISHNTQPKRIERRAKDSDCDSLVWEEFFGPSVEISTTLLDMYDNIVARDKTSVNESSKCVVTNKSSAKHIQSAIIHDDNSYIVPKTVIQVTRTLDKKRPLSVSSVSSSSSSSCSSLTRNGSLGLGDTKKSYLASIESLDDADDDTDDDSLGMIRMNCASLTTRVNSCSNLNTSAMQEGSVNNKVSPQDQSQSGNIPKYWDPNLSHTDRVILEIVETERTYVTDLHEIIQGYLNHLASLNESKIVREDISNLFSNIREIHKFNSNFFNQLEQCGLQPIDIAKCFLQNSSGFNVYTEYCTNYPRTVSLLTEMMRNSDTAEIFKERQITLKHSLPLGSYLLKPVQRILKYHLLLQSIVKYSDNDSGDYVDIKNALSVMTNIAYHINDMKRKHEHAVRVQEIQSLLYNWEGHDLTTYGDLQCEGSFRMFGAKAFRHLFLFDKMLLITKKKDDGSLSYKAHIMCSNLMLIESIQGEPMCFHAIPFDNPRVQYTFQARNLEQKREWCLLLKRVILENYNVVIPSHAKQIVMELGQTIYSETEKGHSGSKRTLSAPEYLERRKHERRKSEASPNQHLQKGFKLRKSLKKMHSNENGSRRARSSSHDESAHTTNTCVNGVNGDCERRSSIASGVMELCTSSNASTVRGEKFESNGAPTATTDQLPVKPLNETRLTEETQPNDAENDTKNTIDRSNVLHMRPPPPRTVKGGLKDVTNENGGDYVTFYISSNHDNGRTQPNDESGINYLMSSTNSLVRTCTPLSSGSSELSMASSSQSEDAKYVVLPVNAILSGADSASAFVRRVQSFTGMTKSKAIIQHTLSFRHSPDLQPNLLKRSIQRPTTLDLSNASSSAQLPTSSSLDEMSPTAPAIWLKRQEQHFASACKKGGSLPRSFESTAFAESDASALIVSISGQTNHRGRRTPHNETRPFTIASDKPLNVDFDGGMESFINSQNVQIFKDKDSRDDHDLQSHRSMNYDSVSTSGVIHPEHKIYKHSASKYLKSMIYSVSSKFVSLRKSPTCSENSGDASSIVSGESGERGDSPLPGRRSSNSVNNKSTDTKLSDISPKMITARFVHSLAKAYSNLIKHKLKSSSKDENAIPCASKALAEIPSPVFARIAVPSHSHDETITAASSVASSYDNEEHYKTSTPKHRCGLQHKMLSSSGQRRPDSLLSEISHLTTSSEGTGSLNRSASNADEYEPQLSSKNICDSLLNDDSPSEASDSSIDSYYERTFEAIESVLAEEMFRDSAIYSDQEEHDTSLSNENDEYNDNSNEFLSINTDDSVPQYNTEKVKFVNIELLCAKRVKGAIIEKLRVLEENAHFQKNINTVSIEGLKSIRERRMELEEQKKKWWKGKDDDEHCPDGCCGEKRMSPHGSPKPNSKGWVKHVIGKLQNDI